MNRNVYDIRTTSEDNTTKLILEDFLNVNGFVSINENGEECYKFASSTGRDIYFKYNISNKNIHIETWFKAFGKEYDFSEETLDNNLKKMTAEINELIQMFAADPGKEDGPTNYNNISSNQKVDYNLDSYEKDNKLYNETMASIALVISIVNVVLSIFGFSLGLIFIVIEFAYGIVGLKSNKRGKAITTIVLAALALIILLFQI